MTRGTTTWPSGRFLKAAISSVTSSAPNCNRYLCSLFTQTLLCSGWMVLGMTWGGMWLSRVPSPLSTSTLPGMLGCMTVGMA